MSAVVNGSDISILCNVDTTISFGARSYDDSMPQQETQTNLNVFVVSVLNSIEI